MATTIRELPTTINAGDTLCFTDTFVDYPATTYTLTYRLVGSNGSYTFTASASGSSYEVDVAAATTAAWAAGTYQATGTVSDGSDRFTVVSKTVEIEPDYSVMSSSTDIRTHEEKTLDAINAVIENRATADHNSYTIAGRTISKMTVEELLRLRNEYRYLVNKQKNGPRKAVHVRF